MLLLARWACIKDSRMMVTSSTLWLFPLLLLKEKSRYSRTVMLNLDSRSPIDLTLLPLYQYFSFHIQPRKLIQGCPRVSQVAALPISKGLPVTVTRAHGTPPLGDGRHMAFPGPTTSRKLLLRTEIYYVIAKLYGTLNHL